jgi:hypothetical protein
MAATAARLACLPATGRRRVVAPQQPQQRLQQKQKNCYTKRQQGGGHQPLEDVGQAQ